MSAPYDYNMFERIHVSNQSLIYRGLSGQDNLPVIIKILNRDFPSAREITQFKREYAIARRCQSPGVIHPLSLRQESGRWMMIQEDIGGFSLNDLLRERRTGCNVSASLPAIPLADFFDIALQLCEVLELVHGSGIIHKDINPSNLVWNSKRRRLQLIDFGIASELAQETQGFDHPNMLEGTLRYMAPEQTGRMNRIVDYRADYYSVGATFYELLTGQAPFTATDVIELVHCHIARTPDWSQPLLTDLPEPLLAILQRLLEKNAERRYQTLYGLKKDLELCRIRVQEPEQARQLPTSLSALSDYGGKFLIPQTLYGRERETAVLLDAVDRVATGPGEMVLVAGYSGIGKSALVNEVHKASVVRVACFVSGKFDQYRRHVPYASLIQAFQGLIRQLLSEPEQQVQHWKDKLREALGENIGVIVELIPELELIVGATDAVTALPPVESQNRLHRLFPRFVQIFSSASHPLVMFLDDLQWADAPTLNMIELLMRDPDQRYMLFIGAYRENEVSAAHPLTKLCEHLRQGGVCLTTLTLTALSEPHVAQLIADTLHVPSTDCAPLIRLCYQKTQGNPFFLNQFLHAIHEAGYLSYDFDQNGWRWDMAALNNADYTNNVVDFMLEKIRRLPPETQQLLQLGASIGNRFELETLAVVGEGSSYQTQQYLWPALQANLIQPLDQAYKYLGEEDVITSISYRFLHDRVQQAAYAVASESKRQENHLAIGRLLISKCLIIDSDNIPDLSSETLDLQLFSVVEQLNSGRALITSLDERLQLANLNRRAGMKARRSAAFQAALRHMRIGIELLPDEAPKEHLDLYIDLQLGAAESAYLCGEFAFAEAIYPVLQAHCVTALQKIRCIAVQAHQYQLQGRLTDAIVILRVGLGLLQMDVPVDDTALQVSVASIFDDIQQLLVGREIDDLMLAAEMHDADSLAAMEMMQGLWMASYYAGQQNLSLVMVLSMTRLSLQQGNSDFTAVAYVAYAFFIAHTQADDASHRFGSMALELANRRTNLSTRTLTCLMFAALINHWSRPLQSCDAFYDDAFYCALESGDFVNVGVVAAVRATDRLIFSQYLPDLLQAIEDDLKVMRANAQIDMVDCCIAAAMQPIKCLMGHTYHSASYDDDGFSEAGFLAKYGGSRLYLAYFYQGKIRNAYFFDSADAETLADQLETVAQTLRGQAKVPDASFYAALIWIRLLRCDPQRGNAGMLWENFESVRAKFAVWAVQSPDNFAAKYLLLQAELARYQQDMTLAVHYYQQASNAARDAAFINIQALSNELCGEFWLEQGQRRVAEVFLHDAFSYYCQWGANGKAIQLCARHELRIENIGRHSKSGVPYEYDMASGKATSWSGTTGNATLDLAAIVKASHALSNEIGLRNVLERLIVIVCENSGAQVARLLLLSDEVWQLEADMSGDTVSVLQARALALDVEAGAGVHQKNEIQFPLSLLRYVARTGIEVIEDSIKTSPMFAGDPYVQTHQLRSVMCLPIKHAGRVCGMFYLENNLAKASFTAERVEFLRILGAQAMISISHARLHDNLEWRVSERTAQLEDANRKLATLSITDGLTGLANRRHFDQILASEWSRATRTLQPLAVMMIDVDYFKKYNDCYGHQAGDECLKAVARILHASMRRVSDLAARYGGEEFSIVLPNTDATIATRIAETIRHTIELLTLPHAQSSIGNVTVSIGVSVASHRYDSDADSLVRAADQALYRAKDGGRNGVVVTEG